MYRYCVNPVASLKFPDPFSNSTDSWYNKVYQGCSDLPTQFPDYTISHGHLYRKKINKNKLPEDFCWILVIPSNEVPPLIQSYHVDKDSNHFGVAKTLLNLSQRFYWKNMRKSIQSEISKCEICKAYKVSNTSAQGLSTVPKRAVSPFHTISIDLVGPLPKST